METDFRSQLIKIRSQNPDAIVSATLSPIAASGILKQYRELGMTQPFIGNETYTYSAIRKDANSEGIIVVSYDYDPQNALFIEAKNRYNQRFGHPLVEEVYGGLGYDAYQVMYQSLQTCSGDDAECVKKELYNIKNFSGISGQITIDKNGDTERNFVLRQIKQGQLVNLQ